MILNLKRYISLLLVLMLLIGIVPTAYAAEPDTGSVVQEDTTEPTEPTDPLENEVLSTPAALSAAGDYAVMSIASTQNSIMLFDYADNGNYTTVLNSQVTCAYKPNGSGTTRTAYIKNLGWHFARYGGVGYPDDPLYCIEPWRSYGASTSGNSVDRGVTLDGSGSTTGSNVWYALPAARREAIGLILLYSNQMWDKSVSVPTTKKDSNPNVPLRIATQFLIYEIVCGLRNPTTFESNSTNECGTSGDIFYNAGEASVPYFAPKYNALVDTIQAARKIPSFTASSSGSAPTITLNGEETSVTDSNGVLSNFSFTDGSGAEFYKSGNNHPDRGHFRVHGIQSHPEPTLRCQLFIQYLVHVGFHLSDNGVSCQCVHRQPQCLLQAEGCSLGGQYQPDQDHGGRTEPLRLAVRHLFQFHVHESGVRPPQHQQQRQDLHRHVVCFLKIFSLSVQYKPIILRLYK